ncbi:DUF6688 family protein [Chitinophaga sp. RCC_12]|uniref:DUF6688 domain-containing protein n=1 Tax=Chitinophaga sp. RCC_12 TaxID=3239226 RepID=UPI003523D492
MIIVCALLFFLGLTGITIFTLKRIKPAITVPEVILANVYVFSLISLFIGFLIHSNEYYTAIDPVDDQCYIPLGGKHIITLTFYFIAFNISLLLLWLKGHKLPPLAKVLSLGFLVTGIVINLLILWQVSEHNTASIDIYDKSGHIYLFVFAPVVAILIAVLLILQVVRTHMVTANERIYSNKFLNKLNVFLGKRSNLTLWSIILILPLLLVITAVLTLFGQDPDSLIKAFTETTTWRFSQQMHPPVLDHKGHYLCTVAVSGDPKIVKPLRLGNRNGRTIIVNRQLLIANAFEEMVQDFSPGLHRVIRHNYDKYGYNLSRKINNEQMANLTYRLMKPLEWIFLICLYLLCQQPEQRINRQYNGSVSPGN